MNNEPISLEASVKLWDLLRIAFPIAMFVVAIIVYFVLDFEENDYLAIMFIVGAIFNYYLFSRLRSQALNQLDEMQ